MASGFSQWGNDLYTGRRSYDIVGVRRRWFLIFGGLALAALAILGLKGLNPGIDFRGGSEFQVQNVAETSQQIAIDAVTSVAPEEQPRVTRVGTNAMRVQTSQLASEETIEVREALAAAYGVTPAEVTSAFVGPTWGKDVSSKAINGVLIFLVLVGLVMTAYFRTWRMAAAALLALLSDLVITVGAYALIGWEVTPATVIGFMTILAYSIYDTVVVFDKVRENTADVTDQTRSTYAERANLAVNQTLVRSINTSVVAVLPVAAILFVGAFLLGAGTLGDIALALFVGMIVGTFSSIFLATPLEVALQVRGERIRTHTATVLAKRAAAAASGESVDAAVVAAAGADGARQLQPGGHLGHAAQPRRRKPHKG